MPQPPKSESEPSPEAPRPSIDELPASLGFAETDDVARQRAEVIEALMAGDDRQIRIEALGYNTMAERLVEQKQSDAYARAQLGLNIAVCLISRDAGRLDDYLADLRDAHLQAWNEHLDEVAAVLEREIERVAAEAKLAASTSAAAAPQDSAVPGESAAAPEAAPDQEPTSEQLAAACAEVLTAEDCAELAGMELADALGYSFTLLLENGVEDPEAWLRQRGILL